MISLWCVLKVDIRYKSPLILHIFPSLVISFVLSEIEAELARNKVSLTQTCYGLNTEEKFQARLMPASKSGLSSKDAVCFPVKSYKIYCYLLINKCNT